MVKNYTRGAAQLPLRCGYIRFGFNHITARWSAAFDANITAYAPGVITTIALSGTARGTSRAAPAYRTDCAIIQNI
jgi:hypothetical protein